MVNDSISSMGGLMQAYEVIDGNVLIPINDLKIVNSKLIELEYEKEINKRLKNIVSIDSIAIYNLNNIIADNDKFYKSSIRKVKRERNTAIGVSSGLFIILILVLL